MENVVHSQLSPEKLIEALKNACPADGWMFLPAEGKITFLFYIRQNAMLLHPVLWVRNTMRKDLYLTLNGGTQGTEVQITPRYTLFFRCFSIFWFALIVVFGIMAAAAGEMFLLIPLGAIALAAVIFLIILRSFAKREEAAIYAEAVKLLQSLE